MMLFWAYPVFLALGLCWYVVIKCGNACTTKYTKSSWCKPISCFLCREKLKKFCQTNLKKKSSLSVLITARSPTMTVAEPAESRTNKWACFSLIFFSFKYSRIWHCDFVPQGHTFNMEIYRNICGHLRKKIQQKNNKSLNVQNVLPHTVFWKWGTLIFSHINMIFTHHPPNIQAVVLLI